MNNFETEIYNYLQSNLPQGLQFVEPYLYDVPIPLEDYVVMNFINITLLGENRSDAKQEPWFVNSIYTIQFDFFGKNSLENSKKFLQTLILRLDWNDLNRKREYQTTNVSLKKWSTLNNQSYFQENKTYLKRWNFTIELWAVSKIEEHIETNFLQKVFTKTDLIKGE